MGATHPGINSQTTGVDPEPYAVSPRQACVLLCIGNTKLYELIGNGELVSYQEGRARRITLESIKARIARLIALSASSGPPATRRGRPRKNGNAAVSP